jgi:hypothetical protein
MGVLGMCVVGNQKSKLQSKIQKVRKIEVNSKHALDLAIFVEN